MYQLLHDGYLRLPQIIGDPKAEPPTLAIIPVGKTTWWNGVRSGRYPQPVRTLGLRITAWRIEDIKRLLDGETDFPPDSANTPTKPSPNLVMARKKFWVDVADGKRTHPRKKSVRREPV